MWKCTTTFVHLSTQHSKHAHSHTALHPPTHPSFLHLSLSYSPSTECQTTAPRVGPLAPASRQGQPPVERSLKRSTQPVNLLISVEHFQMKHTSSHDINAGSIAQTQTLSPSLDLSRPLGRPALSISLCSPMPMCRAAILHAVSLQSTSLRRDGQILGSW